MRPFFITFRQNPQLAPPPPALSPFAHPPCSLVYSVKFKAAALWSQLFPSSSFSMVRVAQRTAQVASLPQTLNHFRFLEQAECLGWCFGPLLCGECHLAPCPVRENPTKLHGYPRALCVCVCACCELHGWGKRKGKTCSSAVDLEDDFWGVLVVFMPLVSGQDSSSSSRMLRSMVLFGEV